MKIMLYIKENWKRKSVLLVTFFQGFFSGGFKLSLPGSAPALQTWMGSYTWTLIYKDWKRWWIMRGSRKQEQCHTGHASAPSVTSCCLLHFSTQSSSKGGGGVHMIPRRREGGIHGKTCNQGTHFPTVPQQINKLNDVADLLSPYTLQWLRLTSLEKITNNLESLKNEGMKQIVNV